VWVEEERVLEMPRSVVVAEILSPADVRILEKQHAINVEKKALVNVRRR